MKKSFLIGVLFLCTVILISFVMNDWGLFIKLTGGASLLSLLISGIFLGAFVSGDTMRANLYSENKQEQATRFRYTNLILVFASPNILATIVYYLITK